MISYAAPSPSVPLLDILPLLPADARGITARLTRHLSTSLGAWPPRERFRAVVLPARDRPGWDGGTWPGLGVESPHGTVFSLSPRLVATADAPVHELLATATTATDPVAAIVAGLGRPELNLWRSVFRWTERPAPSPNLVEWVPSRDPRLPAWLRAFGGDVLVAWDGDGGVAAGVGRKVHTPWAHELA